MVSTEDNARTVVCGARMEGMNSIESRHPRIENPQKFLQLLRYGSLLDAHRTFSTARISLSRALHLEFFCDFLSEIPLHAEFFVSFYEFLFLLYGKSGADFPLGIAFANTFAFFELLSTTG